MAYIEGNPRTKKELKLRVAASREPAKHSIHFGRPVRCFQPGLGSGLGSYTGTVAVEGPHYPEPHRWYATVEMVNGVVVSVK